MTGCLLSKISRTKQLSISLAFAATAFLTSSCAGALFKVKPAANLPPLAENVKSASAGGITIRVASLLSDEESQDLFEANLPLSGVLPLRLELAYESGVPVELKSARFRLHDSEGQQWKILQPKQVISRVMKANDIYAYNPNSKKQFEQDFRGYALDVKTPLTSSASRRQGFLFFQTPGKGPIESPRGLVLHIEGVPQPVGIVLN